MQRIRIAFAAAALALSQQVPAFTIQLDYTYDTNNFFADLGRQAVLSSAASYFEGIIGDSLDAISPGGGNTWTASFTHPGTSNVEQIVDLEVPADTLIIYAGGRNLGGSTLGIGGFGGFSSSGDTAWNTTVSTRGEGGVPATDVGFWGGSVTFYNGGSNWYFDTDTATDEAFGTMDDFYSVALHEIGHALGLGTANSWTNWITGVDFTGPASVGVYGGNVPLDTGLGHWEDGTTSPINGIGAFETAMDPSLMVGTRKRFTDVDNAALTDIGWEVTAPIPLPPAIWLLGSACVGLLGLARRR